MIAVLQTVKKCSISVENKIISKINYGLLVYLGIEQHDNNKDVDYLVDKIINLRIFKDDEGKLNLSIIDKMYSIILVSQFTLCADARKGRRPSYNRAMDPEKAKVIYRSVIQKIKDSNINIKTGQFGAMMDVNYTNHGPVTILLDSKKKF